MAQFFHRSTNILFRACLVGLVLLGGGAIFLMGAIERSPYNTQVQVIRDQPVPFSHEHHVAGLGIDCRYCHTSVERAASAGMPAVKTCMQCHSQIWTDAPLLEPIRQAWRDPNQSIRWSRVHDLPDFVYFNHSIHVAKGVGCSSCHGRVDQMPLMWKEASLQMEWCLNCHRDPAKFVRPKDQVVNMAYEPPTDQSELGARLVRENHIRSMTNCSTCHH
jgi:hypothetical protein